MMNYKSVYNKKQNQEGNSRKLSQRANNQKHGGLKQIRNGLYGYNDSTQNRTNFPTVQTHQQPQPPLPHPPFQPIQQTPWNNQEQQIIANEVLNSNISS